MSNSTIKSLNAQNKKKKFMRILIDYSPAIVMLILLIFNMIFTPNFAKVNTLVNVSIQMTATMLIALGMTWVIASGGIDISVGSVMAVASMVSVKMLDYGVVVAILVGLLCGVLSGVLVGLIIAKFEIQPIIVTLPFMIGLRGVAQILNDSKILRFDNDTYVLLGRYKIGGVIPIQILIMALVIIIMLIITSKTSFGRKIEAVGDNVKAARLTGINITLVFVLIYGTTALLASFAGIIETARIYASDANTIGKSIEMDAIAAVAIGGTSMTGGRPNIIGTFFGAIIMQIVATMVTMNNIPFEYSLVLKGVIIIVALYGQRVLHDRRGALV